MAAGVAKKLWEVSDIVEVLEITLFVGMIAVWLSLIPQL